jgi:uncharacterized membrane protein
MNKYLIPYIFILLTMVILDYFWLNIIAEPMYKKEIGDLLLTNPKLIVAMLFYLIYAFGLFYFVLIPNADANGIIKTLTVGAIFGFVVYSAYDLTNLALLNGWTLKVSIIDISWGAFVSAISVAVGKLVYIQMR